MPQTRHWTRTWQNLNQTEGTLAGFNATRSMPPLNGTGTTPSSLDPALMNAQEMISGTSLSWKISCLHTLTIRAWQGHMKTAGHLS